MRMSYWSRGSKRLRDRKLYYRKKSKYLFHLKEEGKFKVESLKKKLRNLVIAYLIRLDKKTKRNKRLKLLNSKKTIQTSTSLSS